MLHKIVPKATYTNLFLGDLPFLNVWIWYLGQFGCWEVSGTSYFGEVPSSNGVKAMI
jgi:hypothetical protein